MRIVRYSRNGIESIGVLREREIIDIKGAWEGANPPKDLVDVLKRGEDCLEKIRKIGEKGEIGF